MARFSDDFFGDEDKGDFDYDDEMSGFPEHETVIGAIPAELVHQWKQAELDIESQKINHEILQRAISLMKGSFFWRFRSLNSRINLITETYYALLDLVKNDE